MRAVLDTNVIIDLLHFADREAMRLQPAIAAGTLHCFSDRACLDELQRVAAYPQFALDARAQAALIGRYRDWVTLCEASATFPPAEQSLPRCRDSDDQKFVLLAARCRAELLITRDRELLRLARGLRRTLPCAVVTAATAAALIAGAAG